MQRPVAAAPISERVRTLAVGAAPTHVSVASSPRPAVPARGGVDPEGRPVLLVTPGHPLAGLPEQTVVTVDLIACRDLGGRRRTRGMLKVRGWLEPVPAHEARRSAVAVAEHCPDELLFQAVEEPGEAARLLRVDVGQVIYLAGMESGVLEAEDYLSAAPDPCHESAERMIKHVNACHREQLTLAVRHLAGALSAPDVWLWELDRYGITVRAGLDDPELLRLPWSRPATNARELEQALHCLIQHAEA
ncbi:DUF2470 domain-containing protein [Spongiactinospora gelatinilytica]|uniref:DUF2470 domain-containing protein n=1 Tax=Spongiactinospora gelatinilytica TaxID=2666298 RepID=A0A2W2FWC9_9ACTN|nr:DUF2470 domain-containing protein [Spongiactinospora gelatinilytica]PZG41826.1 DUF2470 domain-containing protein [Spongiactinospora gelatinilytica]